MFDSIRKFISYWWFRYLLVTELYMVEKWERVVIHVFFLIVFTLLALFNYKVFISSIGFLSKSLYGTSSNCQMDPGHNILDATGQSNILNEL